MKRFFIALAVCCVAQAALASAGVGITCKQVGLFPSVGAIKPGSPAARAGVPLDGAIMRINGVEGFGMKAKSAQEKLAGEDGTKVVLIITGVNRTDTFTLFREEEGKPPASVSPMGQELGNIFSLLQSNPTKLKGKSVNDTIFKAKKPFTGAKESYLENIPGGAEGKLYRAVLEISVTAENVSDLDATFTWIKPLLDTCLYSWKAISSPDLASPAAYDNYTYRKGNLIVRLAYIPVISAGQIKGYSLDLIIESLK